MELGQNIKKENCDFDLSEDHIDVWQIPLNDDHHTYEQYLPYLSEDELTRVGKYKITAKCYEFSRVRSILRLLLNQYITVDPAAIKFSVNSHGKPYVANHNISFNVTHSHGCALIGFTKSAAIGLDVEKIRTKVDCLGLSKRYFSKNESDELYAIDVENQRKAFFTCWTRKEAFVKALGRGIGFGLDNFDVSFQEHEKPKIKEIRFNEEDAKWWGINSLITPLGYVASICYQNTSTIPIKQFTWQD